MTRVELKKATAPLSEYAGKGEKRPGDRRSEGQAVRSGLLLRNIDEETLALGTDRKFLK